jgi:hypothetical protein
MTIRDSISSTFSELYHLSRENTQACMDHAIQEIHRSYRETLASLQAERGDNIEGLRQEMEQVMACWDRDYDEYSFEWRMRLEQQVKNRALPWCINHLNTLETVLKEILRLSSIMHPALEREAAEKQSADEFLARIVEQYRQNSDQKEGG